MRTGRSMADSNSKPTMGTLSSLILRQAKCGLHSFGRLINRSIPISMPPKLSRYPETVGRLQFAVL